MRHIHSSPKISDRCVLIPAMAPSPTASATDAAVRAASPQASTPATEVRKIPSTAMNRPIPEWGETRLLQAAVLPHQFDLATGRGGMPLWRIGVLADLSTATETVALALFSYSSRSEAEAAAQHMARIWDEPMPATSMEVFRTQSGHSLDLEAFEAPQLRPSLQERTGAAATTGIAGDGPFVAWVALRGVPEGDGQRIRNTVFEALWIGAIPCDLTLFGPM